MFRSLLRSPLSLLRDEAGPTAVEYAVMLALVVVACIAALVLLGPSVAGSFESVTPAP